jgi:hypothetical protein
VQLFGGVTFTLGVLDKLVGRCVRLGRRDGEKTRWVVRCWCLRSFGGCSSFLSLIPPMPTPPGHDPRGSALVSKPWRCASRDGLASGETLLGSRSPLSRCELLLFPFSNSKLTKTGSESKPVYASERRSPRRVARMDFILFCFPSVIGLEITVL